MMTAKRSLGMALLLGACWTAAARGQAASAGTLAISPSLPTTSDQVRVHAEVGGSSSPPLFFQLDRAGATFTVSASAVPVCPAPVGPFAADFDLGTLPAGIYQIVLRSEGATVASAAFIVLGPGHGLSLDGGRFQVTLLRGGAEAGSEVVGGEPAASVQLSDRSGFFWFFDSDNMEVTVKILDGTPVNGYFWLFAASTTDQPFVQHVVDTRGHCPSPPCPPKNYANDAGVNHNFIDLQAFAQ